MSIAHSDMSGAEIDEFLQAPRFAVFATNRRDGPPQLTPVWYLYENGRMYVSMFTTSVKYRNLQRDPRLTLCVPGSHPDARAVVMSGTVELVPDSGEAWMKEINWKLVRRYYDSDEAAMEYIRSTEGPTQGALAVLTPDRILAQDYN